MNCVDISEPIKSCLWLTFLKFDVPIVILTLPMNVFTETRNINIENLVDVFDLHIGKASESIIKVVVYRNRLSEKPDDGYALKFDFTVTGFDEETQSAIMKHDDEKAGATFMLTENVLERIRSTHFVFDLFVVVKMLEFKSLNKNDPRKIRVDVLTRCEKVKLEKEEIEQLGFVLKNPELEDVFTGRLPPSCTKKVMKVIAAMSQNLTEVAEYFKAKYNDKDSQLPNFDLNKLLYHIGLSDDAGPVTLSKAIAAYSTAHTIGLDCLKTAASDCMVHILDENYNVVYVLAAALKVQDEDLIEKAIPSFLRRFHEITHSEIFKYLREYEGHIARLMIHSLRVWVSNHDEFIPGWQTTQLTTEL